MLASTAMLMTCQTLQLLISQVIIFALGVLVALEIRSCKVWQVRSEEHTSELQSHSDLVCRLLLVKKSRSTHPPRRTPAAVAMKDFWKALSRNRLALAGCFVVLFLAAVGMLTRALAAVDPHRPAAT